MRVVLDTNILVSTLLQSKFQHTAAEADEAVRLIRATAEIVEISGDLRAVPNDPEDDKFVETAQVARANCIVSGNHHLLELDPAANVPVITAREFLDRLGRGGF